MPEGNGGSRIDAAGVDAAIAQVLQAERDARAAVKQCARDAEIQVERAQERAREVARRAAQRTARVHRWTTHELEQRLAALEARHAQLPPSLGNADASQRLREAVTRLAAELTGGVHGRAEPSEARIGRVPPEGGPTSAAKEAT